MSAAIAAFFERAAWSILLGAILVVWRIAVGKPRKKVDM